MFGMRESFAGTVFEAEKSGQEGVAMKEKEREGELCWCGSGRAYERCHRAFDEKIGELMRKKYITPPRRIIKNPAQLQGIEESGKVNIAVLDYVSQRIREGVSTRQIDQWVFQKTGELGGVPAPLGYEGFPKSVCTSVNDQVCHGIPSEECVLREGDIINVDVSTIYKGYYSDSSRMFCIGRVSEEKKRLVEVARECVRIGVEAVKPWSFLGDMGAAVHEHAVKNGYTVVEEIGGHGVGLAFHEDPWVGFTTKRGTEMIMAPGMVFTIEPMINQGGPEVFVDESNGWTVYTADGKPSAQWEVTVAVTEEGCRILAY